MIQYYHSLVGVGALVGSILFKNFYAEFKANTLLLMFLSLNVRFLIS